MPKERLFITVKTYPTLSRKHGETVCTAGIREDGSWVRLYPVPFRRLDEEEQYRKFDWVELEMRKGTADHRPETHHPTDAKNILPMKHLGTEEAWKERRKVLNKVKVHHRLQPLLDGAKANTLSLALFKPAKIIDFISEPCERNWDEAKVSAMRDMASQGELFGDEQWRQTFRLMPKLPYNFSYRFEDADGKRSELQVLDWETGQLFHNCLRDARGDEALALAKVRQKYMDSFLKTDLHFFLGTMKEFHGFSPNPWVIIGVLPIPHPPAVEQLELL
ncbi:hypothetical protein [Prosthecobacter sp.]|uniref:hypothetical protein n=1 Tax=Prosthecobacter sp. TaxID=1965333 RepID=UPI002488E088|nr:hypothetical protein [Prosthecobacter sp.]MDI1314741.1 hypothetical protein [Prosthecobacter sp.]